MTYLILKKIRSVLLGLLIIIILSGLVYENRYNYKRFYKEALITIGINGPCDEPIEYSIGTFDERFGITKEKFLEITSQATQLWNAISGKELFKYSETGKLKINLIYDDRQKATTDMQNINNSINTTTDSYNSLKVKYQSLQAKYNQSRTNIESMIDTYENHKKTYEQKVKYWNDRGGASGNQYSLLEEEKMRLTAEFNAITRASAELNIMVDNLNSTAKYLNSLASNIDKDITTYNRISISTGFEFEEGEYIRNDSGEIINIYQYSDHDKLLRVLAHEFGHALGLSHVDDQRSIMYLLNKDSNITLSSNDITALKEVCKIK